LVFTPFPACGLGLEMSCKAELHGRFFDSIVYGQPIFIFPAHRVHLAGFACNIIVLTNQPALHAAMGEALRKFATEHLDGKVMLAKYDCLITQLIIN
jgi:hypothetical protein